MATPKNEALQAQMRLTRTIEASLKVVVPDPEELKFRGSLLRCASSQLPTLNDSCIVRMYEAACDVKFPSPEVTEFRKSLQRVIGRTLDLKKYSQPQPA